MHEPVSLTETSEFFIALCNNGVHSFIAAGVKNEDQINILVSVGKQAIGKFSPENIINPHPHFAAAIKNEPFMLRDSYQMGARAQKEVIRYKAYSIRYANYLNLLDYLKEISMMQNNDAPLMAYCPSSHSPMTLQWQSTHRFMMDHELPTENKDLPENGFEHLSLTNTCRHTALQLISQAMQLDKQDLHVSSFFLKKPLLKTRFSGRTIDQSQYPLYILPPPPSLFPNLTEDKAKILKRLYHRLEQLPSGKQTNPLVLQQFNELKALYLHLTDRHFISVRQLIHFIESWESEHKELISPPNRHHFFQTPSSTEQMFHHIHKDLASVAAHQPPGQ